MALVSLRVPSTHARGCAKLSNDPGICTLIEKAAAAWVISEEQSDSSDINSHTVSESDGSRIMREGEEAKATVLHHADWLVTTCNAAIPDDFCSLPVPHLCTISITPASIGYTTQASSAHAYI